MPKNKLEDLRNLLFETLEKLVDPDDPMDREQASAIANVGRVIVDSARLEYDFMKEFGLEGSGFVADGPREKQIGGVQ